MTTYPDTTPTDHPKTDIGYPHLLINGAVQFWRLQNQLREAATHSKYQKYMQTKFLWNNEQYNSIQWPAFNLAFQCLAPNERQFISKITHKRLPLQASHILAKAMDQQNCPSCLNNCEMSKHFLQCPNPIWQGIWEEAQQGLQKIYIKHNTLQPIQDIISEGYRLSHDPTRTMPTHIANQISVQEVVQNQANLGWKQLIYG